MGRRKHPQNAKYERQYRRVVANKLRRFLKHHKDGAGTPPKAKASKNAPRVPVTKI